jgi:hypothetical protein
MMNHQKSEKQKTTEKRNLAARMEAMEWGLFFIWLGIVFLLHIGIGIGLLGIGLITLGVQVARKNHNLELEKFWIIFGLLFVVGGLWELFNVKLPLVPVLFIGAGVAILVAIAKGRQIET